MEGLSGEHADRRLAFVVVPWNIRLRIGRILAEFREGSASADEAIERLLDELTGGDATTPDTPPETLPRPAVSHWLT